MIRTNSNNSTNQARPYQADKDSRPTYDANTGRTITDEETRRESSRFMHQNPAETGIGKAYRIGKQQIGNAAGSAAKLISNIRDYWQNKAKQTLDPSNQSPAVEKRRKVALSVISGLGWLLGSKELLALISDLNGKHKGAPNLFKFLEVITGFNVGRLALNNLRGKDGFKDMQAALASFGLYIATMLFNSAYSKGSFANKLANKGGATEALHGLADFVSPSAGAENYNQPVFGVDTKLA